MVYCLWISSKMLARITERVEPQRRVRKATFALVPLPVAPEIGGSVHGCPSVRTCVQVSFHELEDEVNVSVVLSFEHVQQPAVRNQSTACWHRERGTGV